ncbi:protein translocase subunit SecD, partial [Patescibacteria group bacterium]|nr:protein translocase subunit SecD [Patescibacteria group bacterium]
MRKKIWLAFAAILVLTILAGVIDYPKGPDLKIDWGDFKVDKEIKINLGLDLQGGAHLVYEADMSNKAPEEYDDALAGVKDVIERKVNALGLNEPVIQTNKSGNNYRVIIELPGVTDVNEAIEMI